MGNCLNLSITLCTSTSTSTLALYYSLLISSIWPVKVGRVSWVSNFPHERREISFPHQQLPQLELVTLGLSSAVYTCVVWGLLHNEQVTQMRTRRIATAGLPGIFQNKKFHLFVILFLLVKFLSTFHFEGFFNVCLLKEKVNYMVKILVLKFKLVTTYVGQLV